MPQPAAEPGIESTVFRQAPGGRQDLELSPTVELIHGSRFEQASIQKTAAQFRQGPRCALLPALKVIAGPQIIVGKKILQRHRIGIPQPAAHHTVSPDPLRAQLPSCFNKALKQPVADHVEAMVVNAAIHQAAHHQIVLHSHQTLGMNGEITIGCDGQCRQNPLQIELSVTGSSAVAVSEQVIKPVAVQLTAHQSFDQRMRRGAVLEQIRNGIGGPLVMTLQAGPNVLMFPDHPGGTGFVTQSEHLLAGMAEWPMADVMKQGSAIEHTSMGLQPWIEQQHPVEGVSGEMKNPQ